MNHPSIHNFHIPVMGLAYTIDSPIKVARFGISSVISIIEDRLVEMMRKHYYSVINLPYLPISQHEDDYRARRITDYLNLVNTIVKTQIEKLRSEVFEKGSEICKYFEMLPDTTVLKKTYRQMTVEKNPAEKKRLEEFLRRQIKPGNIDVNIMTKTDRNNYHKTGELIENGSDAVSALRGFVKSNLVDSSVIFSAGMNPRLYNYLENCTAFEMNKEGRFSKKIVIKVTDYRSALIQGKYLAKKGIWVSEFRIESGLNCGGHAFATEGYLMGPILEEFKEKRQILIDTLFEIYNNSLEMKNREQLPCPPAIKLSAQGGIGTYEEDVFLHQHYGIDSTGWGTPFLLVPEATTVDEHTLKLLCDAKEKDILLSRSSPLGVRFHYLKGTSAETERLARIRKGKPGSPCTEKHLEFNTEFTSDPICTASHKYQKLKIAQLQTLNLKESEYNRQLQDVLAKECLCVGLSNAGSIKHEQPFIKGLKAVSVCPGPNIVNYSSVVSLETMIDHIYGRKNIVTNPYRPHIFIAELHLYIDYLIEQLEEEAGNGQLSKKKKYFSSFYQNLRDGILYYQALQDISITDKAMFEKDLFYAEAELDSINSRYEIMNN